MTTRQRPWKLIAKIDAAEQQVAEQASVIEAIEAIEPEVTDSWGTMQFTAAQTDAIGRILFHRERKEAVSAGLSGCDYYRGIGTCTGSSCATAGEPLCITDEPREGWAIESRHAVVRLFARIRAQVQRR